MSYLSDMIRAFEVYVLSDQPLEIPRGPRKEAKEGSHKTSSFAAAIAILLVETVGRTAREGPGRGRMDGWSVREKGRNICSLPSEGQASLIKAAAPAAVW